MNLNLAPLGFRFSRESEGKHSLFQPCNGCRGDPCVAPMMTAACQNRNTAAWLSAVRKSVLDACESCIPNDRRETLGLHIVVTKLVEIPFAHVEGAAECRPHVRPSTVIYGDRCSALVTYPMNCFPMIAAYVCEGGYESIQAPMTVLKRRLFRVAAVRSELRRKQAPNT